MRRALNERGLFRVVLLAFSLLLAYRFLSGIVTALLLLGVGLLLAVALSAAVETLHRRKVPRPAATGFVFLGVLAVLGLATYLLLPNLEKQVSQLAFTVPDVISMLGSRQPVCVGKDGTRGPGRESIAVGSGARAYCGAQVFAVVASHKARVPVQ